ncbi:MAG: hypothetical protein E6J75_02055 [Deltaproteobacteria bacterium]|nr:MAG: hypothetical protein E6J75_02055 [Deltaproteobacteria bacterium]
MTSRGRRWSGSAGILAALAMLAGWWLRNAEFRLPTRLGTEQVVADLSATFDRGTVAAEAPADPVRLGVVQPGEPLRGAGQRAVVVTPPGARLYFRVTAPAGGALRFGAGVDGTTKRSHRTSDVRFSVMVDGREVYRRRVNPAAHHRDRRWFDERIDLGVDAERPVEIVLETAAERPDLPSAGMPGWSRIRVVRSTTHERQPASPSAPNVLVLLVDTLRADRVGCYGAQPSPSPTLDGLAGEGLVFENAIAQSSWTLASVASILSGLYPRSHGAGPMRWSRGPSRPPRPASRRSACPATRSSRARPTSPRGSRPSPSSPGIHAAGTGSPQQRSIGPSSAGSRGTAATGSLRTCTTWSPMTRTRRRRVCARLRPPACNPPSPPGGSGTPRTRSNGRAPRRCPRPRSATCGASTTARCAPGTRSSLPSSTGSPRSAFATRPSSW